MSIKERIRIAILMDVAFSDFQETIKSGLHAYLQDTEIDSVFFSLGSLDVSNPNDLAKTTLFQFISNETFDGLIIISTSLINYGIDLLKEKLKQFSDIPMISIGPSIIGEPNLLVDNINGMKSIMEHLIVDHKYTKFAYISGPFCSDEAILRLETFTKALDSANIPHSELDIYEGNFLPLSGVQAIKELLGNRKLQPDVIVCANDFMAIGASGELKSRGLSIPFDIALTGFDDVKMPNGLSHQITTAYQPFEKIGFLAIEKLHNIIKALDNKTEEQIIPAELRIKNSCGCSNFSSISDSLKLNIIDNELDGFNVQLNNFISSGCPNEELNTIYSSWESLVTVALSKNISVYEIENILRETYSKFSAGTESSICKVLVNRLYTMILENNEQGIFADYWNEITNSENRRFALVKLNDSLKSDQNIIGNSELYENIKEQFKANSFHIYGFKNRHNIKDGVFTIYSDFDTNGGQEWIPSVNSWIPPISGSVVVCMLHYENKIFGYFIMDSTVHGEHVYIDLAIELSNLFNDIDILQNIQLLNNKLKNEIGIRKESEHKLKEAIGLLNELSIKDELTGLNNRRGFLTIAEQQIKYFKRHKIPYLILFADLDGLKTINDTWGHKDGDLAILAISLILSNVLRDSDIVARLGGDEFVALVNLPDNQTFEAISNRINSACDSKNSENSKPWDLSVSIGHYFSDSTTDLSLEKMLDLADAELYKQKRLKKK